LCLFSIHQHKLSWLRSIIMIKRRMWHVYK
jgi:hypothetical protein